MTTPITVGPWRRGARFGSRMTNRRRLGGEQLLQITALGQAGYYVVTGVWPLLDIDSFQKVTGPKTDLWLVRCVGVLITVVGGVIGFAAFRRNTGREIAALAVGCAAGLAGVETVTVARRRISPIYLLDAAAEALLIAGWLLGWRKRRDEEG
jgi:hypothetical protein